MIGLNVDKVVESFRSELAGMRADIVGVRTDLAPLPAVLDELAMIRQLLELLAMSVVGDLEREKMITHECGECGQRTASIETLAGQPICPRDLDDYLAENGKQPWNWSYLEDPTPADTAYLRTVQK